MVSNDTTPENQQRSENDRDALVESVASTFPPEQWAKHPVLLAISGGPDSVALLRILLQLGLDDASPENLVLVHCNYRMRGVESDADEAFVRQLADTHKLKCLIWRAESLSKPGGAGWEAYLRDLRYEFFKQVARDTGARYLTLAHTASDQAETVLLRLLRGSSLAGLRGIPFQRPLSEETTIVRPLLHASRQEVREYLSRLNQPFRLDSSNESNHFLRNRIRNHLLPLIAAEYSPEIEQRLLSLAAESAEHQSLLDQLSSALASQFDHSQPDSLKIDCSGLATKPNLLVRQALIAAWRRQGWSEQDLTARHWHALAELLQLPAPATASLNLPGNLVARRLSNGQTVIGN